MFSQIKGRWSWDKIVILNILTRRSEQTVDPGHTAPVGKVCLDTSKDRQTNDLVKFYLQTGFQVPPSEKVEIKYGSKF